MISVTASIQLFDFHPVLEDFRSVVLKGLGLAAKHIPPTWLYDKAGAELFVEITRQPEYYLTRTEIELLRAHAAREIGDRLTDGILIEFGSGSSQKVRILLDALQKTGAKLPVYMALDISKQHLQESCEQLAQDYPEIEAIALCADYTQPLTLPDLPILQNRRKTAFFPGSTLGNLEPQEAVHFLKNVARLVGEGGGLLLGVDLKKSKAILEPAYNDAAGVSAAFALNLLERINRELGANFDLKRFRYEAVYNESLGRIEMYLVSLANQTVEILDQTIRFAAGEHLRTEHSYKYSPAELEALAQQAGFTVQEAWSDASDLFQVSYWIVQQGPETA